MLAPRALLRSAAGAGLLPQDPKFRYRLSKDFRVFWGI